MPPQNIFPAIRYRDCDRAISWLKNAFGFEEKAAYRGEDGAIHHAELRLGHGLIMLGQDNGTSAQPPSEIATAAAEFRRQRVDSRAATCLVQAPDPPRHGGCWPRSHGSSREQDPLYQVKPLIPGRRFA